MRPFVAPVTFASRAIASLAALMAAGTALTIASIMIGA